MAILGVLLFIGGLVGWLVVDATNPAGTVGNKRGHLYATAAIVGGPFLAIAAVAI